MHGRRRVGQGDSFWQFRPFVAGDPMARIDWRQSAKSGRPAPEGWFIRETEWEAAQTVCLWRDASASMRWRSRGAPVEKRERAGLLLLALASLLLRGGERVALIAPDARPICRPRRAGPAGRGAGAAAPTTTPACRRDVPLPRHARVVLFGDFLSPLDGDPGGGRPAGRGPGRPATCCRCSIRPRPTLPYSGRIRFRGLEREGDTLIPRVEGVRDAYAARLKAQQDGLAAICAAAGFGFGVHRTDHSPEAALLGLYTALTAR